MLSVGELLTISVAMTDTKDAAEAKKPPKQQRSPHNKSSAFIYDLILWTLARINLLSKTL